METIKEFIIRNEIKMQKERLEKLKTIKAPKIVIELTQKWLKN